MLSMRSWRHERTLKPDGDAKTVVRDRLTFELRMPLRLLTPVIASVSAPCSATANGGYRGTSAIQLIDHTRDVETPQDPAHRASDPNPRDLVEPVDERIAVT